MFAATVVPLWRLRLPKRRLNMLGFEIMASWLSAAGGCVCLHCVIGSDITGGTSFLCAGDSTDDIAVGAMGISLGLDDKGTEFAFLMFDSRDIERTPRMTQATCLLQIAR